MNIPQARPTRFKELGYRLEAPNTWRVIDMSTDCAIGHAYRTKTELLADLARFAKDFGCDNA